METIVTPRECALALAIPLTKSAFLADLHRPHVRDFGASVQRQLSRASEQQLWNDQQPLAAAAVRISKEVERLGVTVCRDAALSDFARLCRSFDVVTLVTNWRCPPVRADDILEPVEILDAVRRVRSYSRIYSALHDRLAIAHPDLLEPGLVPPAEVLRLILSEQINCLVSTAHQGFEISTGDAVPPPIIESDDAPTRADFELAFPAALRAGSAIDFGDDRYTAAEFIDAIPEYFSGTLDLTVRYSPLSAESIKRRRKNCSVIADRRYQGRSVRLSRYRLIIGELARQPGDYIDTVYRVDPANTRQ